jgi:hypothetical protein
VPWGPPAKASGQRKRWAKNEPNIERGKGILKTVRIEWEWPKARIENSRSVHGGDGSTFVHYIVH